MAKCVLSENVKEILNRVKNKVNGVGARSALAKGHISFSTWLTSRGLSEDLLKYQNPNYVADDAFSYPDYEGLRKTKNQNAVLDEVFKNTVEEMRNEKLENANFASDDGPSLRKLWSNTRALFGFAPSATENYWGNVKEKFDSDGPTIGNTAGALIDTTKNLFTDFNNTWNNKVAPSEKIGFGTGAAVAAGIPLATFLMSKKKNRALNTVASLAPALLAGGAIAGLGLKKGTINEYAKSKENKEK